MRSVLAKGISAALHPVGMPLLALVMLKELDPYLTSHPALLLYLTILLSINTAAPALSFWLLRQNGIIADLEVRNRKERVWPFLLVLGYFSLAYGLTKSGPNQLVVPAFYQRMLLSLVIAMASAWVVTLKFKISMHMLAQGGLMAMYLRLGFAIHHIDLSWVSILLLTAGLVGWSRLRLQVHQPLELYFGYALGWAAVWFTFW